MNGTALQRNNDTFMTSPLLQRRTKTFLARHLLVGTAAVLSSSHGLVQVERVPGHEVEHQFPAGQRSTVTVTYVRR